MKHQRKAAPAKKSEAKDSRAEVIDAARRQTIGIPFHTTPASVAQALTAIRDLMPGSTAKVQEERLEKALRRWPLTSFEMLKHLDLYDPRARIQGLRLKGLEINRVWVLIETDCGQRHRVGRYALQRGCTVPALLPNQPDLFRSGDLAQAIPEVA